MDEFSTDTCNNNHFRVIISVYNNHYVQIHQYDQYSHIHSQSHNSFHFRINVPYYIILIGSSIGWFVDTCGPVCGYSGVLGGGGGGVRAVGTGGRESFLGGKFYTFPI